MPKVSKAHLAARREQLLAAATRCFARGGFHRTTMHDIVREAGLSAGAAYRYFRGKEEIVETIARERHQREREALAGADRHRALASALRELARAFVGGLRSPAERAARSVGVQVWAEALRDPRLRALVRRGLDGPRSRLATLVRTAQRRGEIPKELSPDAVARVAIALFHGLVLQQAWEPELDVAAPLAVIEAALDALG